MSLGAFRTYVGARDYGTHLQVLWYLAMQPGSGNHPGMSQRDRFIGLNVFDEQELRAYVGSAHDCVVMAVTELMLDLEQDPSRIDSHSRGFLGIS